MKKDLLGIADLSPDEIYRVLDTAEAMRAVRVPTLGIVGTLDHTLKEMQELKQLRPDMKLVLLEGVSHTGQTGIQGRPELVTAIRDFIASQRSN